MSPLPEITEAQYFSPHRYLKLTTTISNCPQLTAQSSQRTRPLMTRTARSCRGAVVPCRGSAAIASDVASTPVLIDPGPIPYWRIELFGDPDLEHGLRHMGLEPEETAYRLLEIPIDDIGETRSMASWTWTSRLVIEAMKQGSEFPPIVVFRKAVGWNLIDGVNRSYAAWHLGLTTIRAYELIQIPQ